MFYILIFRVSTDVAPNRYDCMRFLVGLRLTYGLRIALLDALADFAK